MDLTFSVQVKEKGSKEPTQKVILKSLFGRILPCRCERQLDCTVRRRAAP